LIGKLVTRGGIFVLVPAYVICNSQVGITFLDIVVGGHKWVAGGSYEQVILD